MPPIDYRFLRRPAIFLPEPFSGLVSPPLPKLNIAPPIAGLAGGAAPPIKFGTGAGALDDALNVNAAPDEEGGAEPNPPNDGVAG